MTAQRLRKFHKNHETTARNLNNVKISKNTNDIPNERSNKMSKLQVEYRLVDNMINSPIIVNKIN